MIVCKSEKELANATNASDAAGAVAVKEYIATHGDNLTPSTVVKVSGVEKTLESYIEDLAEDVTDDAFTPVDITNDIAVVAGSTGTITITKAVKTGHYVEIYGVLTATTNISAGSNIAVATLNGIPAPVSNDIPLGSSLALFGESLIGVVMSGNGSITARYYIGSVYSAGSSSVFKIGYITTD